MRRLSRRTLLAGTGTAALVAVAGCIGGDDGDEDPDDPGSEEETRWREELDLPESVVSALAFVYEHGDEVILGVGNLFASGGDVVDSFEDTLASADIESRAQFGPDTSGETVPVTVLVGEFELEPDAEGTSHGSFTVHEVGGSDDESSGSAMDESETLATNGEVLLLGGHDRVTATLDSHESDQEPYLATEPTARAILNELWATGAVLVSSDSEPLLEEYGEDIDIESIPAPVGYAVEQAQDTVQWQFAAGTADESVAADLGTLAGAFSGIDPAEFEHRVTDGVLVVEAAQAVTPPGDGGEDGPSLAPPQFETYDEQTGEILLQFVAGESISVENATIEIDGDPYEGDWARGAEEIGEGSLIALDADAVEPGDSLTVTYEGEDGTSASTGRGQLLTILPVAFSYDAEERTATFTYEDGPPLPGERTEVRASAESSLSDSEQVDPLSGGLTKGDSVTVDGVDPGTTLLLVYERTDGDQMVIAPGEARPPGRFGINIDDGTVTVVRTDEGDRSDGEPAPADRYEVRIDGTLADTQWSDQGETVEPGDTLAIGNVATGSEVSVVWVGETTEVELAARRVPPDMRVAVSYDPEEQRLTLVHDGGESVDADALTVIVASEEERTVSWDGDTVAEGDELTVEEVPEETLLVVQFQGETLFEPVPIPEISHEDGNEIVFGADSEE
jgi:hypothetical protein